MSSALADFETTKTREGFRLSQHGVVLSELRSMPGPTDSVFDVLAALVNLLQPDGRVGVLGFAGGSMMAPLRSLGASAAIEAVDLDRAGYDLFREHCASWAGELTWQQVDAVRWLRAGKRPFDAIVDDLSIPQSGDVTKPEISWTVLPGLIRDRLAPAGVAIFNMLKPDQGTWKGECKKIAALFQQAAVVHLDAFENRILVAGSRLPSPRELSAGLRAALVHLRSRQAGRFHVRGLSG